MQKFNKRVTGCAKFHVGLSVTCRITSTTTRLKNLHISSDRIGFALHFRAGFAPNFNKCMKKDSREC